MKRKTLKQLEAQEVSIRREINLIREKERKEKHLPVLRALVGACFACRRNSYSCPAKEEDYWDVFRKVVDFIETPTRFYLVIEEVSVDSNGAASLSVESHYPYPDGSTPFSGYEHIELSEYEAARITCIQEMATHDKMRRSKQSAD